MNARMIIVAGLALVVAGCVGVPSGPSMLALPGTGKSLNDFRASDFQCRQYAAQQIAGYGAQARYDNAYIQCMYAGGHKVPVPASMARTLMESTPATGARSEATIPPPPAHAPPTSPPPDYVAPATP